MKKIISIVLAAIMLISTFAVFASADVEPFPNTYTINFALSDSYDGKGEIISSTKVIATAGTPLDKIAKVNEYDSFVEDNVKYYFAGWYDPDTGLVRTSERLPKVNQDKTYVAVFEADTEVENGLTLMQFIASIFARLNDIFEYFYTIFFT